MIAEMVMFQLPAGMSRDDVLAAAYDTVPGWQANGDLLRKHYLLDEDNRTYGFYLWRSREAAERAHGSEFRQRVRERFGCEPSISYYDALLVLDNLNGEVSEDLGGPVSAH